MGDLREELIRLAERLAVGVICARNEYDANPHCSTPSVRQRLAALAEDAIALRALLASHPAPSPRSEAPALPVRNTSTEEGRAFWASAEQAATGVESWPDWKRAGINEAESRARARSEAESPPKLTPREVGR